MTAADFLTSVKNKICTVFGHRWKYEDYSNYTKNDGDQYEFKAFRYCRRCNQNAYFYDEWKNLDRSWFDYESHYI